MFILNMTPVEYKDYRVGVPEMTTYKLLLNSTDEKWGGPGGSNIPKSINAKKGDCDWKPQYIAFDLPAYGGLIFQFESK